MTQRFWHGGAPGLRAGDLIEPRPGGDEQHLVDGCPTCEARRSLSGHLGGMEARFRALRLELRQVASAAPECVVSESLEVDCS